MGSTTVDSKPLGSYPNSGIDVLIIGTGLAGLTAAIECTRKGHNVRVLERNATINTAGESLARVEVYNMVWLTVWNRRYVLHGT